MMGDARMADLVTKAGAYKAHVGLHLEVRMPCQAGAGKGLFSVFHDGGLYPSH